MDNPDWTLYRSFLAVAETGSLSAAARHLEMSQPTIGRHIAEIETALGLTLFTRVPKGYSLTESGSALVPHAKTMRDAAAKLSLVAAGHEALSGTVRITASCIVAEHILPKILAELRVIEPLIEIDLVPSDVSENLLFREADIAVRMYRPTQLDVITTHVADLDFGIYAAKTYLDRVGRPKTEEALLDLDFVGFDRSDFIIERLQNIGVNWRREDFPLRCDDQIVQWSLVRAGCGVGGMQCLIADADPLVERINADIDLPSLPVWLTAPEALRQSPRIRRVFDYLSASFRSLST